MLLGDDINLFDKSTSIKIVKIFEEIQLLIACVDPCVYIVNLPTPPFCFVTFIYFNC